MVGSDRRAGGVSAFAVIAVVVAAVVAGGAVYAWQSSQEPVYASTSLLAVDSPSSLAAAGGRPENLVFLAQTYAARTDSRPVVEEAVALSGLPITVEEALQRSDVTVSNLDATITIRTTGPTPEDANALNQALITTLDTHLREEQLLLRTQRLEPLQAEIAELEARFAALPEGSPQREAAEQQYVALVTALAEAEIEPLDRVQVLSPPNASSQPIAPKPVRAAVLAFIIAGAIAAQILVAQQVLRRPKAAALPTAFEPSAAPPAAAPPPAAPPPPPTTAAWPRPNTAP